MTCLCKKKKRAELSIDVVAWDGCMFQSVKNEWIPSREMRKWFALSSERVHVCIRIGIVCEGARTDTFNRATIYSVLLFYLSTAFHCTLFVRAKISKWVWVMTKRTEMQANTHTHTQIIRYCIHLTRKPNINCQLYARRQAASNSNTVQYCCDCVDLFIGSVCPVSCRLTWSLRQVWTFIPIKIENFIRLCGVNIRFLHEVCVCVCRGT